MRIAHPHLFAAAAFAALAVLPAAALPQSAAGGQEMPAPGVPSTPASVVDGPRLTPGEILPADAIGPIVIEGLDAVLARQAANGPDGPSPKARNGAQGEWEVPSMRATRSAHSGVKHLINRWGDTRLGVGFDGPVDLSGAWLAGQGTLGSWTDGVQVIGFRGGVEVGRTEWFETIGAEPAWFAIELSDVDRVEFVARPVIEGAGWYALDDLTFAASGAEGMPLTVLDFEDLDYHTRLTGSGYAGLQWERGTGDFVQTGREAPKPGVPPGADVEHVIDSGGTEALGGSGTTPSLIKEFIGPKFGDAGANLIPPDTCGAVGTTHFLSGTNANLSAFVKSSGLRVMNVSLTSFWGVGGLGDPRVAYDPHHDRWAVLASNFSNRVYIAYSLTGDPTGAWLKTNVLVAQGSDLGKWPDYPTIGLDANGVYFAAYMVGGANGMSIFSVDKAPMLSGTPTLGTVTAWRLLPWEGAIQPCLTYGNSGGEYLVSRRTSTTLRLRQITGPLTSPTLVESGNVVVPSHSSAPNATQMGTSATLDTIDWRPMNAVYRNGSVWTAHSVSVSGRAAVRWYQINATTLAATQVGTISDPVRHYYMPGISVNASDQMVVGFSGSSSSQFVGAYLTGRLPTDPPNETGAPLLYKAGEAPYTQISSSGVNRWGDYSLTSVDPVGDASFWTIQEYARTGNTWVTRIGQADYECTNTIYCTSKVSTNLCVPSISSSGGTASMNFPSAFQINTTGMEQSVSAINFFGTTGQASIPFQGGTMCVGSPVYRMSGQNSGGGGTCLGAITYTLQDVLSTPVGGALVGVGTTVNIQTWSRDVGDPFGSSLSNALQFQVCP
jgi:hypothetical protein